MLIYKDAFTGEEYFTDASKLKEIDEFLIEVESRMIKIDNNIDSALLGGNPAEGAEDEATDDVVTVNDIINNGQLQELTIADGSTFVKTIKDTAKKILDSNKLENPEAWKGKFKDFVSKIKANVGDYNFYLGPSAEGMLIISRWENDIKEIFMFFKHGIETEKA